MKTLDSKAFQTIESAQAYIGLLEQEFQSGSGQAGYLLALIYSDGNTFVPDQIRKTLPCSDVKAIEYQILSFPLLRKTADRGDGESMHLIASYYQCGIQPVSRDPYQFGIWTEKAFHAGYGGGLGQSHCSL